MKHLTKVRSSRKRRHDPAEPPAETMCNNLQLSADLRLAAALYGDEAASLIEMLWAMTENNFRDTMLDFEISPTYDKKMAVLNNSKAFHDKRCQPLPAVASIGLRLSKLGGLKLLKFAVETMRWRCYVKELDLAFAGIGGYRHKSARPANRRSAGVGRNGLSGITKNRRA